MKYTYACKKVPLNDSIKDYAEKRVEKLEKYFHRDDASAFVTFTVEKDKLCTVEITIRDGSTLLRAQTTEPDGDMRGAIDAAVSYIERQILKNKTRLAKRLRSDAFPAAAPEDALVIGGASVYRALLDRCDTAYVTKIDRSYEADCWFPDLDSRPEWRVEEESPRMESDGVSFRYVTYRRR